MLRFAVLLIGCLFAFPNSQTLAWSVGGHHLVAQMAFSKLDKKSQDRLVEILKKHPRFNEDFQKPGHIKDNEYGEWLIGRAAFWPDAARSTEYDRPDWHYQLGSSMTIGNESGMKIPKGPTKLPPQATLQTKDMHIVQAFELCLKVFKANETSDADRAVTLCWILHMAEDAHQPCHAGALYQRDLFPRGDKGGNLIETVQAKNLHALWDGLLGPRYDKSDIRRRISEIESSKGALTKEFPLKVDTKNLNVNDWIQESQKLAEEYVYTPEVVEWVSVAVRSKPAAPQPLKLSEEYLKKAGRVAQLRAFQTAERLQLILTD